MALHYTTPICPIRDEAGIVVLSIDDFMVQKYFNCYP